MTENINLIKRPFYFCTILHIVFVTAELMLMHSIGLSLTNEPLPFWHFIVQSVTGFYLFAVLSNLIGGPAIMWTLFFAAYAICGIITIRSWRR